MPELLEKYSQENLLYRDEEFTQQAESFIGKIAIDKRSKYQNLFVFYL